MPNFNFNFETLDLNNTILEKVLVSMTDRYSLDLHINLLLKEKQYGSLSKFETIELIKCANIQLVLLPFSRRKHYLIL